MKNEDFRDRAVKGVKYSMYNREIINNNKECGCYYCEEIFDGEQIEAWTDCGNIVEDCGLVVIERFGRKKLLSDHIIDLKEKGLTDKQIDLSRLKEQIDKGDTAICPKCGIDSVVSKESIEDIIKTEDDFKKYLNQAHNELFGVK